MRAPLYVKFIQMGIGASPGTKGRGVGIEPITPYQANVSNYPIPDLSRKDFPTPTNGYINQSLLSVVPQCLVHLHHICRK
jgi:hypothetical protein